MFLLGERRDDGAEAGAEAGEEEEEEEIEKTRGGRYQEYQ